MQVLVHCEELSLENYNISMIYLLLLLLTLDIRAELPDLCWPPRAKPWRRAP